MNYLLLATAGCHLCELAEQLISECHFTGDSFNVELIDIAEQTHWQQGFAAKIPVLLHQESKSCLCWPFTQDDILTFIKQHHD